MHLPIAAALVFAAPATLLHAQAPWQRASSPAESEGYARGYRAGEEDSRRGQVFDYRDESDYRSADAGYRSQYGSRDRYRDVFRLGYERGYGEGYSRYRDDNRYNNGNGRGWARGRGPAWGNDNRYGYGYGRSDVAAQIGFTDGYDEGLKAGRDNKQFDPIGEGRYRSGDHGYDKRYGNKDAYRARYREAFRDGYASGYSDGRRYDRRYDDRRRDDGRPWWWPF